MSDLREKYLEYVFVCEKCGCTPPLSAHNYIAELESEKAELIEVLKKAMEFISNGIIYWYIQIPELKNDTTNLTPDLINNTLKKHNPQS